MSNEPMSSTDRAWTPRPWSLPENPIYAYEITGVDGSWVTVTGEGGGMEWSPEDAILTSLAPEMAEAILAWRKNWDETKGEEPYCPILKDVWMMADKLRAIGRGMPDDDLMNRKDTE